MERSVTMSVLEAVPAIVDTAAPWQGAGDMDSFYVLIASLLLAFVAFVILMRIRF